MTWATNKMQQIPLSDFLNQLYMFRATNAPILRRTFLTLYTAFGTVRYLLQTGALYQNLYIQSKSSSGIYSFRYNAPIFTADRCIVPKYVHTVKKFFWYIQPSVQCTDICCRPVHCTKSCIYSQKYSWGTGNLSPKACRADLTRILLTWKIWWAPNNAAKWQMGFK